VLLGAFRRGDRLRLMVADDGIGVPAERQAAIFEPFVQSDDGRAAGGLGLGLAIAARLARLLDAEIRLQSRPGKGSRFWIDVALEPAMR
jgi:signal transduction histidine kinase